MKPVRAVAGAAVALATAAVVARRSRHRKHDGPAIESPVGTGGRAGRTGEVAKTAGRIGLGYGLHQAQRTFASAARRDALDEQFLLHSAEQVTETLGNLKGVMMKIGQMASYLDLGLPEPMRRTLADLQAGAPPMAPELATSTVEAAFGRPIDELFAQWDPVAIASASIGQVHRALTTDGRAVAVKVQYPGIAEAMAADLEQADVLFAALGVMFPALEAAPLVEELRDRLSEELDYEIEASNQRFFADAYRDHPTILVPDVVDELSNATVLTSDLLVGRTFAELAGCSQQERSNTAETIFRFVMRSLYCLDAFNGDPHPGNYLILDDGRVAFVDFGLVKHFTREEIDLFVAMHRAMVIDDDPVEFRDLLVQAGIIAADAPLTVERLHDYFVGFYEHFLGDGPRAVTEGFATGLVSRMFDTDGEFADVQRHINVPPGFLLIQRINLGLYALFAELGAEADWSAILGDIVPWIGTPPATPMGAAERAWLAASDRSR